MHPLNVVASGDFQNPDGSPAYPGFDFVPLSDHPGVKFSFLRRTTHISPDEIAGADVLVLSGARVTTKSFHRNGRLGLIVQFGAGYDHIDLESATRNGVAVVNTPHGVRRPMAVAILTLILALVTKLPTKARLVGQGPEGWAAVIKHNGIGLTGKTLGSVGLGNIGADLFRIMRSFAMHFAAHDPYADPVVAAELGVELVSLDSLFGRADILCLNCPLTDQTRHLVDARRLGLMKSSAYLVNTSRGAVVDQQALTAALAARQIAGAALDVFEHEPLSPMDPLLGLDNVVLTPHSLCWSDELYAGCGRDAVNAVLEYFHGRAPRDIVNREVREQVAWRAKLEMRPPKDGILAGKLSGRTH